MSIISDHISTKKRPTSLIYNEKQGIWPGNIRSKLTPRQREILERIANVDIVVYQGGGPFQHGYYRDPVANSDMLMVLRYGWPPGEGQRRGLEPIGPNIWRIP